MDDEKGSSLHCSQWNPNAIHKGASHYSAHIYPTNTHTHTHTFTCSCSYIRRIARDLPALRSSKRSDAWHRGTFHGVQSCIYMAANCAAMTIRTLISYEIVKSRGKFIREVQNRNNRATHWKHLGNWRTAQNSFTYFPQISENSEKIKLSNNNLNNLTKR